MWLEVNERDQRSMLVWQKLVDNVTSLLEVQASLTNVRIPEEDGNLLSKTKIIFLSFEIDNRSTFWRAKHQNLFSQCENRTETKLGNVLSEIFDWIAPTN
jgi:hypothetical protein